MAATHWSDAGGLSALRQLLLALCGSGDAEGLRRLLRVHCDSATLAVALFESSEPSASLPLHVACDSGHSLCALLLLLEHRRCDRPIDTPNVVQATPLHLAARSGAAPAVRGLLLARADPSLRTRKGRLAAELAAEHAHTAVLDALAAAPAAPPAQDGATTSATHRCALSGLRLGAGDDASLGIGPRLSAPAAAALRAAAAARAASAVPVAGRPRVFLEFVVEDSLISGRVEIELYADLAPRTAHNFRALCTGECGASRQLSRAPLHYKGSRLHRIIPGFVLQGGDFTSGDGRGGESVYGGKFADESFDGPCGRHSGLGCLSMANSGRDSNGSQFFITLKKTPHLDGKHVVFGRVIKGFVLLTQLEALGSASGAPSHRVVIADCGELLCASGAGE